MESLEHRQLLAVVALTPLMDNSLIEYKAPTYSGGAETSLFVGLDHWTATRMRGVMAFDVAGNVPAGATINSVTLSVWVNLTASTTVDTPSVELHKTLADWGEGTSATTGYMPPYGKATTSDATWLNTFYNTKFWATPGGDFSPTVSGVTTFGADNSYSTWNSTTQMVADVQSWLNDPGTNFGWLLKGDETQDTGKMIDSRESATVAHRPTLTINYTPAATAPSLAIAATDASKSESNSGSAPFAFTVTRSGNTSGTSTVNYAVTGSGPSAASAPDFASGVLPSGSVTFAAGVTSQTITINVNGDTTVEPDESFTVTLASPVGATITTAVAAGAILNDDTALAISPPNASKSEGHSGSAPFAFTVTRSGNTSGTSTVNYAVAGSGPSAASAPDFASGVLPSGSVTFAAGVTSQTITINVNGDTTVEPDEGFTVTLASAAGATITTAVAAGVILNDDSVSAPSLAISATDASKSESNSGSTPFAFTVTRSGDTSGTSTINYVVAGSGTSAADATDFASGVLPSGSVTFAAGEASQTITINVNGDTTVEPDESFTVTLASPVGATITTAVAAGAILNDDSVSAPSLAISATDASKPESNSGSALFAFTVTRSGDTSGTSTVNYVVAGSGPSAADATDFASGVLPSGSVTFAAGEASQTITINVNGDKTVELNERFVVNLSNPTNATIAQGQGTGIIINDDQGVSLAPDGSLSIAGTDKADAISVSADSKGRILVIYNGKRMGPYNVAGPILAYGGGGNDRIIVASSIRRGVLLDGGAGNDTLYGGSGNDNLYGGAGNDVLHGGNGVDRLYGEDGNDSLYGEAGNDVLVGGLGNDQLEAGSGRNLLIGGDGRDSLRGGSSDDILIGGRTTYDNNDAALAAIMTEWTSNRSFKQRRANLTAGIHDSKLGLLQLNKGTTVLENTTPARDALAGGSGDNWLFDFASGDDQDHDDDHDDDHGDH